MQRTLRKAIACMQFLFSQVSQKPKAKSSRTQLFLRNFHLYDILALPVVALDGNQANNVTLRIIVVIIIIIIIINEYLEVSIPDLKLSILDRCITTLLRY